MNSFMSWVGGKKALREAITMRLPSDCDRYVEVFGGGGWVLFFKSPSKFEVYNDFNPNLANLYRCVRDYPEELCKELTYTLNSRTDFEHVRKTISSKTVIPDIKRAAYFYQLIRESYASGLDSFGAQPHSMWRNFPLIHQAAKRLQTVVVENKDFEKLIAQYDRPNTIFYLDPPYYETEDYYEDVGFTEKDHVRLRDALANIKGKFLLSYNDCPEIRELYSMPGIMIESTTRLSNIAQRYDAGKQYVDDDEGNMFMMYNPKMDALGYMKQAADIFKRNNSDYNACLKDDMLGGAVMRHISDPILRETIKANFLNGTAIDSIVVYHPHFNTVDEYLSEDFPDNIEDIIDYQGFDGNTINM